MADKPAPKKRHGGRKPILDAELVAAAIAQLQGNISAVARKFGVERASVQEMIAKRPSLQRVLADARAGMVDNVESRFYSDCLRDSPAYQTSRIFFLKTQAKDRGYVEKQEIEHSGVNRLVIDEEEVRADGEAEGSTPPDAAGVPPK